MGHLCDTLDADALVGHCCCKQPLARQSAGAAGFPVPATEISTSTPPSTKCCACHEKVLRHIFPFSMSRGWSGFDTSRADFAPTKLAILAETCQDNTASRQGPQSESQWSSDTQHLRTTTLRIPIPIAQRALHLRSKNSFPHFKTNDTFQYISGFRAKPPTNGRPYGSHAGGCGRLRLRNPRHANPRDKLDPFLHTREKRHIIRASCELFSQICVIL